jgi:hypothetical protein
MAMSDKKAGPTEASASTYRWFVTAHTVRPRLVRGETVDWPASTAHAKRMGMNATACGIATTTWPKLFHLSFPVRPADICPVCWTVVADDPTDRRG